MRQYARIILLLLTISLLAAFVPVQPVSFAASREVPADFVPMTQEELNALYQGAEEVTEPPELTELGKHRIAEARPSGSAARSFSAVTAATDTVLPKAVDNSKTKYFPPIAKQIENTCGNFTYIYYTLTNNTALARDIDVKALGDKAIFSPTFCTENALNGVGSIPWLVRDGGVTLDKWPFPKNLVVRPPANLSLLREALRNRAEKEIVIKNLGTEQGLSLLKQYLANGYVFGTDFGASGMDATGNRFKDNPESTIDDPLVGQYVTLSDSTFTDHALTIVGYNDDVWFDANKNGVIETTELGAIKLANSWGSNIYWDGFEWIPYGYLRNEFTGHGYPDRATTYIARPKEHTPRLLAEFVVGVTRDTGKEGFSAGVNWGIPGKTSSSAFVDTVPYGSGMMSTEEYSHADFTVILDYSDIITDNNLDLDTYMYDWYIKLYDIRDECDAVLKSFKLTDADGKVLATYKGELPQTLVYKPTEYKITYGGSKIPESTPEPTPTPKPTPKPTPTPDEPYEFVYEGSPYLVPDIAETENFYIDLGFEQIVTPLSYSVMAYSTDGGTKWNRGHPNMSKLLDKPLKLMITDEYDASAKKPADDATIITFPQVEARPKSNPDKLVINYAICANDIGATPGAWTLAKKGEKVARIEGLEYAPSRDKKNPDYADGYSWFDMDDEGVEVLPLGSAKQTYLARTAPVVEKGKCIPASKPFKLSPAVQQRATNIKADYKKEIIKLKAGLNIFGGTLEQLNSNAPKAISASAFDEGMLYTAKASDSKNGILLTTILDRTDMASDTTQTVCIWIPATDKKPASNVQEYTLAVRADIASQTFNGTNGKVTLPNTYEVYDSSKSKWSGMPKVTASVTLKDAVRIKSTARAAGTDDSSQLAASKAADLTVEYGVYTSEGDTAKSGVLSVRIGTPPVASELPEDIADNVVAGADENTALA